MIRTLPLLASLLIALPLSAQTSPDVPDSVYWRGLLELRRNPDRSAEYYRRARQAYARDWLTAPIYFAKGSAQLDSFARADLLIKARLLAATPEARVIVMPVARDLSTPAANAALARERMAAVRTFLIQNGARSGQVDDTSKKSVDAERGRSPFRFASAEPQGAPPADPASVEFTFADTAQIIDDASADSAVRTLDRAVLRNTGRVSDTVGLVRVLYATDRNWIGNAKIEDYYGADKQSALTYGSAIVSIPVGRHGHRPGRVERRGRLGWLLRRSPRDPSRYFVLDSVRRLSERRWFATLNRSLAATPNHEAMVYVHGYNVSFNDAMLGAAQMAWDLQLRSVPIVYSWSAVGKTLAYVADLDASTYTVARLTAFLHDVARRTGNKKVNVLAHSMGNRALVAALEKLAAANDTILGQVVLVAADEDVKIFTDELARSVGTASRISLYASEGDLALKLSESLRKRRRAGQAGADLIVLPPTETIDASDADTDIWGHGYHLNSLQVLDDLRLLMNMKLGANDRLTDRRQKKGSDYWVLPPR